MEADFKAEAFDDNPVFIPFCTLMLCELGASTGASCGASNSTSGNYYGDVGTNAAAGFHHRSANAHHDKGSRPRRNANPSHPDKSSADSYRPGPAREPEYTCGALSDLACNANATEWNGPWLCSNGYNRWCPCAVTHGGAAGIAFKYRSGAYEQ